MFGPWRMGIAPWWSAPGDEAKTDITPWKVIWQGRAVAPCTAVRSAALPTPEPICPDGDRMRWC
jgi:hypothetical protein